MNLYDMAHRKHSAANDAEEAFSAADYAVANPPYEFWASPSAARPGIPFTVRSRLRRVPRTTLQGAAAPIPLCGSPLALRFGA